MSEVKKQKIGCPKCGRQVEIDVCDKLEMPYDIAYKESVLKNRLFRGTCGDCKIVFPIAYKCTYNDMEKKFFIWNTPKLSDEEKADIMRYNERIQSDEILKLAQGGYRYRLVLNENEFREKVFLFEEGLDDRYVETMKLVYVPILKKNYAKDSKIAGLYMDKKDNGEYVMVVAFDNQPPMAAVVNLDIYNDMKVKLKDIVEAKTPEGLARIDANWALEIMMQQVDGEQQQ